MNLAIISDLHFGDDRCRLRDHKVLDALIDCLLSLGRGPLDYLVLNGDILDFSVAAYHHSFADARRFYESLQERQVAKRIIHIPGNHDKHVWDALQWDVSVISNLTEHANPKRFLGSQPALLDYTRSDWRYGHLAIDIRPSKRTGELGGTFLEGLFNKDLPLVPVIVVYPNLYIRTHTAGYLVTHGHMLKQPWMLLSDLLGDYLLKEFLPKTGVPRKDHRLRIEDLEAFNVPLNAMICTGVGQAGDMTHLIHRIIQETRENSPNRKTVTLEEVLHYVARGLEELDSADDIGPAYGLLQNLMYPFIRDQSFKLLSARVVRAVRENADPARYTSDFFAQGRPRTHFRRFFEAASLQAMERYEMAPPNRVIFGHTHVPMGVSATGLGEKAVTWLPGNADVHIYNTGGWLDCRYPDGRGGESQEAAEVFLLDHAGTLTSVRI